MALGSKIIWLFVASALEVITLVGFIYSEQTLMITTGLSLIIVMKVAFSLFRDKREMNESKRLAYNFIKSELIWIKKQRERLNYKHPEKLKEYFDNKIRSLQELIKNENS